MLDQVKAAFIRNHWFERPGAYVLVDGQYGSTGKGAIAALIGATLGDRIDVVTTNAGPNSGHTGYLPRGWRDMRLKEGEPTQDVLWAANLDKIVTRQIPVASVVIHALKSNPELLTYLNAGTILDPAVLFDELGLFGVMPLIHPLAAVISPDDVASEKSGSIARVASTGKGVGAVLARKVRREQGVVAQANTYAETNVGKHDWNWGPGGERVFVETAQGFSLGLNEARFYPFVTSRECTVMQAISDARIPAQMVQKVIMTVRTHPIRVGNTDKGQSGGCYPDQQETTWQAIGQQPELTTVTQRVRRVFTWSRIQFREAVAANRPDVVVLTFMDYLKGAGLHEGRFIDDVIHDYDRVMGRAPDFILTSWGPRPEDVRVV